jgi:lysyl-tRNA synthetase, class II
MTSTQRAPWRPVAALATAAFALLTVASSLTADEAWRERALESIVPDRALTVAHVLGVIGGLVLLVLAHGLWRGRRRAGPVAVATLCLLAAVHAAKGLDYEEAATGLVIAAAIAAALRGRGPRLLTAGLALLAALAAAFATSLTALLASGHDAGLRHALWRAVSALAGGPTFISGDWLTAVRVGVVVALVAALVFVRALLAPARAEDGHDAHEHARAARIVAAHGGDALAPFVLRADKAFFFAHGGVLAYRTLRETAVVSGDPVGPEGRAPAIVADFLTFAERRGWDVVLTGASLANVAAYRRLGLRTLQIGVEAVAVPAAFSLEGRAIRKVRQSVHRIARRGWHVEIVPARELTAAQIAELESVELAWRASRPRLYGFAMAMDRLWGAPEDINDLYILGRAPDGSVHAFLRFVPYGRGLSLDAMRRLGDEPNGLTEALVVAALEEARARGCAEVSLNFAGFAHVMAAEAIVGTRQRALRWALRRTGSRFQLQRLIDFNERFAALWRPRFLVYTAHTRLPLAGLRVLQAEAYVRAPRSSPCRAAWRPQASPVRPRVAEERS